MTTDNDEPMVPDVGSPGWVDDGRFTDLSTLDPEFVARIRATGKRLIEEYRQSGRQ